LRLGRLEKRPGDRQVVERTTGEFDVDAHGTAAPHGVGQARGLACE
jgi:hypothetical protein